MHIGFGSDLLDVIANPATPNCVTAASCGALRSFTTADDERPPASKAFTHARMLAKHNSGMRVILAALKRAGGDTETAVSVLAAVKQVGGCRLAG